MLLASKTPGFWISTWDKAPQWVNVILVIAAVATASAVIWRLILAPLIRPIHKAIAVVPSLVEVAEIAPKLQQVAVIVPALEIVAAIAPQLGDIAAQFRNNGGSSLRDAVDRIEKDLGVLKNDTLVRIEVTLKEQGEKHLVLDKYVHTSVHKLANAAQEQIGRTMNLEEQQAAANARAAQINRDLAELTGKDPG